MLFSESVIRTRPAEPSGLVLVHRHDVPRPASHVGPYRPRLAPRLQICDTAPVPNDP